ILGRDDSLLAIRAHCTMAAVVEKDHVAAVGVKLARDFLFDHRSWWSGPVIAGHIPQDRVETQFTGDAQRRWTPSTEWRAKQVRMLAYGVVQRMATIHEFCAR